jgi:site-specific recombinase XerD
VGALLLHVIDLLLVGLERLVERSDQGLNRVLARLQLRRRQRESAPSPFVFVSERGASLSAPGFSRLVERAAIAADLGIKAHAHMLRHDCGYKLANDGHDTRAIQAYLGHRNIQNTTRYTALAPQRFKEFFRD